MTIKTSFGTISAKRSTFVFLVRSLDFVAHESDSTSVSECQDLVLNYSAQLSSEIRYALNKEGILI